MGSYDSVYEYFKSNKKTSFLILCILIIIVLSFSLYIKCKEKSIVKYKTKIVEKECKEKENLMVDIKGQVKKPDIYEVKEGTRISDVIKLAGGLLYNANTRYLNLSKKVTDEEVIIVYSNEEIENMKQKNEIKDELDLKTNDNVIESKIININTATIEELMTLNGIGEAKAKAIISYREKTKFLSIEDILNVSGIGESLFEQIKEYITV